MHPDRLLYDMVAGAAAPLGGAARMAAAVASDVARAVDLRRDGRDGSDDPLDRRDPDYIRATLPALRLVNERYFRGEVRGLENVPREGGVLLVGNHSGGTQIADTYVFAQAFYDFLGPERPFHQLAHDLVFRVPGVREMLARYGTIPASPANMRRALDRGAALLVYPGGDEESFRPSWQSARVDFAGRTGFVRLALDLRVPVVPVAAIGGQETALFLGRGRRVARALRLNRVARLKVLPPQIGPPFGMTVLDFPGRVPLPAKITVQVLPPLDLAAKLGPDGDPKDGYRLVTDRLQEALSALADERRLPVLG